MPEKKCNGCGVANKPTTIPYAVHESNMTRAHKEHKWLVGVIVLLIVLLFGSNCAWLWYESQFEIIDETTTQTTTFENVHQATDNGSNNIVGGDYINGKSNDR